MDMETVVRNVKDLDAEKRRTYEELLGCSLLDNQQIVIHVLTAGADVAAIDRDRALDQLRQSMDEIQRNVGSSGLSDDEIGQIIDEAIAAVRAGNS